MKRRVMPGVRLVVGSLLPAGLSYVVLPEHGWRFLVATLAIAIISAAAMLSWWSVVVVPAGLLFGFIIEAMTEPPCPACGGGEDLGIAGAVYFALLYFILPAMLAAALGTLTAKSACYGKDWMDR